LPRLKAQPAKQYFFTHYTTRNGLLSNRVASIAQDQKGFLWIATINGLQRFDGHKFLNFQFNYKDDFSIPTNEIWDLLIDKNNNLWLVFANGQVGLFNTATFKFTEIPVKLPDEKMRGGEKRLIQDSHGRILLFYPNLTLLTYSPQKNSFAVENNSFPIPPGWHITSFAETNNEVWMCGIEGVAVYNYTTKTLSYNNQNVKNIPALNFLHNIKNAGLLHIDKQNRLWIIHWPLYSASAFIQGYDLRKNQPVSSAQNMADVLGRYSEPKKIIEQNDGRLIIVGTPMLGEYDESEKKFIPIENITDPGTNKEYDDVLHSFSDKEQNIWLGTLNDGLYKFNPSAQLFTNIQHLHPQTGRIGTGSVLSIIELNDKSFLTGIWGDGVFRYDSSLKIIPNGIKGLENNFNSIWCFAKNNEGNIWMGLQRDGGNLGFIDLKNKTARQFKILERKTIRQIVEDRQGNLWLGTHRNGLFKWTATDAKPKFENGLSYFKDIDSTLIEKLYLDKDGFLWVSTIANGLYKINTSSNKIIQHLTTTSQPKLLSNSVGPILQYNDSLYLIAGGGLTIYNNKQQNTLFITTAEGLSSSYVMSIIKDDKGYVWLGMLNGLCRLDIKTMSITNYNKDDGLLNDNFTIDAAYKLSDGRIVMGTNKDMVIFNPDKIANEPIPPDVTITDFKIADKSLLTDSLIKQETVTLPYNKSAVSIDFASLSHLLEDKITYYYKLEPLEKEWKVADIMQRVSYSYLAPGHYQFMIKAANGEGNFSKNITSLSITVDAPFWETWWFYSLLILLAGFVLFLFDKERMKRKEASQKMRTDIADNLHKEINTALSNINILSEMARLKAENEPAKSKEFIEQIHAKSHNMMIAMDDMLWSIDPSNDSMGQLIKRLEEYSDAMKNRHGVQIDILADKKVYTLPMNMKLRKDIYWFFRNGITTVVSSGGDNCRIHITYEKPHIIYTLDFDTSHINRQLLTNRRQREELNEKLNQLHAQLKWEEFTNRAVFTLKVPVN
jgi:ligand-binding sensor domain-containing protein